MPNKKLSMAVFINLFVFDLLSSLSASPLGDDYVLNAVSVVTTDSLDVFATIAGNVALSGGVAPAYTEYTWNNIPDDISQTVVIRATDLDGGVTLNPNVADDSGVFHIIGGLRLDSPVGGEDWSVGTSQAVTWTPTGSFANIKIYYSSDSGSSYGASLATRPAADGSWSWTTPVQATQTARIKITDADPATETTVLDASASDFHLVGVLDVTAPENGAPVTAEETTTITWAPGVAEGITDVILEYSLNGGSSWAVNRQHDLLC